MGGDSILVVAMQSESHNHAQFIAELAHDFWAVRQQGVKIFLSGQLYTVGLWIRKGGVHLGEESTVKDRVVVQPAHLKSDGLSTTTKRGSDVAHCHLPQLLKSGYRRSTGLDSRRYAAFIPAVVDKSGVGYLPDGHFDTSVDPYHVI
jgi:restriction endonuclease Mrr